jgi:hypothetical protein
VSAHKQIQTNKLDDDDDDDDDKDDDDNDDDDDTTELSLQATGG